MEAEFGTLYVLSAATGELKRTKGFGEGIYSSITINADGNVFVSTVQSTCQCVDFSKAQPV
ncbi:MAG TPA: hypothetical protein PKC26_02425, partial [Plasticicumulans sp.]|nr:hypothetical protein [Plasticicumulans sp.]